VALTPGCSEGPVVETVTFELPAVAEGDAIPWSLVGDAQPGELVDGALPLSSLVADLVPQPLFINMSRGSSPAGTQEGVIPTSLETFGRIMPKPMPLSITAMPAPSTRRRRQASGALVPRRSVRLTKKGMHQTLVITAAQNILSKKMGLSGPSKLMSEVFECYICIFQEGLSEEQA
jgi:hypothetical protein